MLEFQAWNFNKKDTLAQVFFCEYYGIFMEWSELLFYGVAASGKVRRKSRDPQNFSFSCFWLYLISRAPSTLWQDNCKIQSPQEMMCDDKSIHIAIQTLKHLNIMKIQFAVICSQLQKFPYIHWVVLWNCFSEWFECEEHVSMWESDVKLNKICRRYATILINQLCGFNKIKPSTCLCTRNERGSWLE